MYDYIIVGGGSAGAVLANRLSEDPERHVLLVEAGENWRSSEADEDVRSANFLELVLDGRYMWTGLEARLTEAQDPEPYLVGKGLGGGSTINAQFWARPPRRDFDRWAALGCRGWDGETMQPYLNSVEADPDFGGRPYHGGEGPIPVWRAREERGEWGPVDYALRDAVTEFGHTIAPDRDLNAPDRTGLCDGVYNRRDGERVTTNDAYIEPVRHRDNLVVKGQTLVDRVLFEGDAATGVAAITPNGRERFESDRVVLTAGAIFSPAILARSGIGPRADLESMDVPIRSERPGLGRLLDHPQLSIVFPLEEDARLSEPAGPTARVITFWSSDLEEARENDLHVLSQNYRGLGQDAVSVGGLLFGLTDSFSEGRVRVTDTDPTAYPDIWVNMLDDPRDRDRVVAAVRHLEELLETPAFRDIVAAEPTIVKEKVKTVPLSDLESDERLAQTIRESVDSYDHPAGTCRMGAPDDPDAVVDPNGAVIGVEDLYVADASIMPDIVTVQTNYAVIAVAERIADLLRN